MMFSRFFLWFDKNLLNKKKFYIINIGRFKIIDKWQGYLNFLSLGQKKFNWSKTFIRWFTTIIRKTELAKCLFLNLYISNLYLIYLRGQLYQLSTLYQFPLTQQNIIFCYYSGQFLFLYSFFFVWNKDFLYLFYFK